MNVSRKRYVGFSEKICRFLGKDMLDFPERYVGFSAGLIMSLRIGTERSEKRYLPFRGKVRDLREKEIGETEGRGTVLREEV